MPAGIAPKPQPGGDREAGIDSIARLVAIDTDRVEPREFRLEKRPVTIGTARDNDLVVTDTTVSRHHARIRRRFGRYRVTDLGSTNGTFVNGRRLRRPFTLKRGDELRVGAVLFAFLARGGAGAARRSRPSPGRRLATLAALALLLFAGGFALARYAGSSDAMRRIASLLPGAWAPGPHLAGCGRISGAHGGAGGNRRRRRERSDGSRGRRDAGRGGDRRSHRTRARVRSRNGCGRGPRRRRGATMAAASQLLPHACEARACG